MIMGDGKGVGQLVKDARTIDTLIMEDSKVSGLKIEPETWAKSVLFSDSDYAASLKDAGRKIRPIVVVTPDGQVKCITYDMTTDTTASFVILNLKAAPNNNVFHLSEVFDRIYDIYERRGLAKPPVLVLTQSENAKITAFTSSKYTEDPYVQISGVNFRCIESKYRGWQVVAQREFLKEYSLHPIEKQGGQSSKKKPADTEILVTPS